MCEDPLQATYDLSPTQLDIAAMLPDFLEYRGYDETEMPHVWEVTPQTQRFAQGVRVVGFPEPLLAQNAARFGIGRVWGLDMRAGSEGIAQALAALMSTQAYDLILACDVGGDFIAATENYGVLSPMMDAYALYGLRQLQASNSALPLVGAVFGPGTDGESCVPFPPTSSTPNRSGLSLPIPSLQFGTECTTALLSTPPTSSPLPPRI